MDNYIVTKTNYLTKEFFYLFLRPDGKTIWCEDQELATRFTQDNAERLIIVFNSCCDDNYLFSANLADIYVIKNILSGYHLFSYVNECIHWTDLLEDANHFSEKSKAETVVKGLSVLFGDFFTVETLAYGDTLVDNPKNSD